MYRVLLFFLLLFAIVFFYLNTMESDILGSDIISSYMGSTKENFTTDFKDILPIQIGPDNNSISVPNTIGGNNKDSTNPFIQFQGDVRIRQQNCIEFARDFNKDVNAGKIRYMPDRFDIVGAANSGGGAKKVKIWDHLETGKLNIIEDITCQRLNITSDKRVKHKKMVLDANESLAQIKQLTPTQFEFKSEGLPVYGFIAQEVQQVVPTCVTSQKSYIANIHDRATLTGNQLTFKEFDTKDLEYTKEELKLYPNLKLKRDGQERHVSITRIVDEHTVEVKDHAVEVKDHAVEVKDLKDQDGEYLVYGQEVDDFLTIDKNQLFALTTSGLQALDAHQQALHAHQQALANQQQALTNHQQAQDTRVQELEHQLQEEREQNKTTLHRILQRISSLEAN
jgi:hypothetical protein